MWFAFGISETYHIDVRSRRADFAFAPSVPTVCNVFRIKQKYTLAVVYVHSVIRNVGLCRLEKIIFIRKRRKRIRNKQLTSHSVSLRDFGGLLSVGFKLSIYRSRFLRQRVAVSVFSTFFGSAAIIFGFFDEAFSCFVCTVEICKFSP